MSSLEAEVSQTTGRATLLLTSPDHLCNPESQAPSQKGNAAGAGEKPRPRWPSLSRFLHGAAGPLRQPQGALPCPQDLQCHLGELSVIS